MKKQKKVWSKSRYGEYYNRIMGKEVKIQEQEEDGQCKRIYCQKEKQHWPRDNGYNDYYCEIYLYPINQRNWKNYLKRIKDLKKEIKVLGKIPAEESTLIAIIKYLVKLVSLVTKFRDEGMLDTIPTEKVKEAKEFYMAVVNISSREKSITTSWKSTTPGMKKVVQFWNQSKKGETVTYNNMWLGMYSRIIQGEDTSKVTTAMIEDEKYKVDVTMSPVSNWISKKVKDPYDYNDYIRKVALAETNKKLYKGLLDAIDSILE